MTLNVPSEFESVIAEAVTAGLYRSREDAIRHALELFARELRLIAVEQMPSSESVRQSPMSSTRDSPGLDGTIPESIDADSYVRQHGAAPIEDTASLRASFWPEGLSVEEFLQPIDNQGRRHAPRD